MKHTKRSLIPAIVLLLSSGSCANENTETANLPNQSSDSTITASETKYSIEEEQKVYGNITFGISRPEYNKLVPSRTKKIGEFRFEFIPSFDNNGKLYSLSIKGLDKQTEGRHDAKGYLIKLMRQRYGRAGEVNESRLVIEQDKIELGLVSYPKEIEFHKWNIHNKTIVIYSQALPNQDHSKLVFDNAEFYVYPVLNITHKKMKEEFDEAEMEKEKKSLENEANKF